MSEKWKVGIMKQINLNNGNEDAEYNTVMNNFYFHANTSAFNFERGVFIIF